MKKILAILAIVILVFSVGMAQAASNITFEWDANSESDLAGYRLYQSQTSGNYISVPVMTIPAGTETAVLSDIPDGTYFWVLTAYDVAGNESGYSNEVTASLDSVPPVPPEGLLIGAIEKIIAGLQDIKAYLVAQRE